MTIKTLAAVATLASLAIGAPLAAQNTAARPAPAQQPAQQQAMQVTSVPHICRVREQELLNINRNLNAAGAALRAEKDQAKRQASTQQMQAMIANLQQTEASWDRMGCAQLLYGVRPN